MDLGEHPIHKVLRDFIHDWMRLYDGEYPPKLTLNAHQWRDLIGEERYNEEEYGKAYFLSQTATFMTVPVEVIFPESSNGRTSGSDPENNGSTPFSGSSS